MSLFYYLSIPILYSISFVIPFYKTFKTLQKISSEDKECKDSVSHWLKFWILSALSIQIFSFYERVSPEDSTNVPIIYLLIKIAWFYWLSLPQGSTMAYQYVMVPTFVQHESKIDHWFDRVSRLINSKSQTFISSFQNQRAGLSNPRVSSNISTNAGTKKRDY